LIDRLSALFFHAPDLERAARPFVQQPHEFLIDLVDATSQLLDMLL
jgi:hypothetical protein